MPSLALIAAITISTSAPMPTTSMIGTVSNAPMPSVAKVRISRIRKIADTVILKFSASLAWSATKGMVSFFISQMTSGPRKKPQPPTADVSRPPASADRWANIAHCRSSAGMVLAVPTGTGSISFIRGSPHECAGSAPDAMSSAGQVEVKRRSAFARDGHPADQDRTGTDVRARIDIVADRLDRLEHRLEVAGDGDAVHRIGDRTALDPETGGTARVISGDRIHPLPHQFGDQQAGAHAAQHRLEGAAIGRNLQVVHATGIRGGLQAELA